MFMAEKHPTYVSLYFKISSESDSGIILCKKKKKPTEKQKKTKQRFSLRHIGGVERGKPGVDYPSPAHLPLTTLAPTLPASSPWLSRGPCTQARRKSGPAACPDVAQHETKLGLTSQRWMHRELLGKKRALTHAHFLTFTCGSEAKRIQNFRRLDLVEANRGPSHLGALRSQQVPLPAPDLRVSPQGVGLAKRQTCERPSPRRRGRLPNLYLAALPRLSLSAL